MSTYLENKIIEETLKMALEEDLGISGDITSYAIFSATDHSEAVIKSKAEGVVSGMYILEPLFRLLDPSLAITLLIQEGTELKNGTEICLLKGAIRTILAGERIALNFLQHLSGIATKTANLVSLIRGTGATLLDTRKTTPTLRFFEKKAVITGGGKNHRFNLSDMILIKDTHVKAAGGPYNAVEKAKIYTEKNSTIKIEVEVQSKDEFIEAFKAKPDRIMLDNMKINDMRECVLYRNRNNPEIELEASGNITEQTIRAIAETGVDFISSGSITHSVNALDIHLIIL